ncbi:hypothetical protein EV182_001693 [Spiromyces aspiralis]|uniref:Uncharacterized protein n=1 Tax=Spiromyces aspiralis TaxID=68401 RepID=A0ACC1HJ20_9FUNG|nr:hypothetical protein EV182_001693 [Spiromyces aspiralis]
MLEGCITKFFTYLGMGIFAYTLAKVASMLVDFTGITAVKLERFGAGKGYWAVITGCTDGIGKALAFELARKEFNLVLISRSQEKLEALAKELEALEVETKIYVVDFSKIAQENYDEIKQVLDSIPVGVLVNNVGLSYDHPSPLLELPAERGRDIIKINNLAMVEMTRIVLPQMRERKSGLIINNGSFSALVPTAYLTVYSASKAFVSVFSQALGLELEKEGIMVQHLNTYFVCSSMTKIKRPSFFIPSTEAYARNVIKYLGAPCGSILPFTSVPHFGHALIGFVSENLLPAKFLMERSFAINRGFYKRWLKRNSAAKAKAN